MRDWKVFRPDTASSTAVGSPPQKLVRKRQSGVDDPLEANPPQFEIALDMDADQLTLMFEDADKFEQRAMHTPTSDIDHQEAWRREALQTKPSVTEAFGPWSNESRLEGSTYFRKATRLI